jgi:hypothetical protein
VYFRLVHHDRVDALNHIDEVGVLIVEIEGAPFPWLQQRGIGKKAVFLGICQAKASNSDRQNNDSFHRSVPPWREHF